MSPLPRCAGHHAWQLLQRLAALHLQHAQLDAGVMLAVRAHLQRLEAPTLQQLALAYGPLAAAKATGALAQQEPGMCGRLPGRPGGREAASCVAPAVGPCTACPCPAAGAGGPLVASSACLTVRGAPSTHACRPLGCRPGPRAQVAAGCSPLAAPPRPLPAP
jgi:hypothetical protein